MKVRLSSGRAARARIARGVPVTPSTPSPFPQAILGVVNLPEIDPEFWPNYVLDWDEDGVPHIVDIDASIEWDGWRVPEIDQVEGGAN
jgi:hypothetical protein